MTTPTAPPSGRDLPRRILGLRSLRLLLGIALIGWGLIRGLDWLGGPAAIREQYGLAAGFLLVPVHAVVAVSPVPSEIVAFAQASVYGFLLGSAFVWLGWFLGAWLEYALFRRVAGELGGLDGFERLPRWLRRLPAEHPLFLIGGRLVPFGNHFVNASAGLYRVPFLRFTWTSALALLPASILVSAIANGIVAG